MSQTVLPPIQKADPPKEVQLAALARRYRDARGPGMQLLTALGARTDTMLDRLPQPVRTGLDKATLSALERSFDLAARSRGPLPDTSDWLTRAVTMGTGAVGGLGGMPTALSELPVTTTVILRAVQGIAAEHGFDPQHTDTKSDCIQVFAASGPLDAGELDLSFLQLRMALTGHSVQAMLRVVAPKLAATLGSKLAAQSVPVVGAVAGAAINYTFTSYYQDVARVQFGLRRLAEETGHDRAALIAEFEDHLIRL
ncbi:MAG: EcsC family protein [Paracoccaceae bacterium]